MCFLGTVSVVKERTKKIISLYESGLGQGRIARLIGIGATSVIAFWSHRASKDARQVARRNDIHSASTGTVPSLGNRIQKRLERNESFPLPRGGSIACLPSLTGEAVLTYDSLIDGGALLLRLDRLATDDATAASFDRCVDLASLGHTTNQAALPTDLFFCIHFLHHLGWRTTSRRR
ncbi:hypothetical protein [Mesorhizobium sp. LNHC252B00]|uniref:hypothetical protein n=1 Tax=Mesorhizobium sp. LNHC252B00 TaxID=1287252 RepID=UPI0012EC376D|nr:hypothetical protein [Mesorhizobium sp. LNHC252B00]